jgi:pimeloyl-ACP methyl ester carboxylesterase
MPIRLLAALLVMLGSGCATLPGSTPQLVTETFMIPAVDPGIQLHVRNKRPAGQNSFGPDRIVLFVHGATFASEPGFDVDLPGGTWMEFVARRGFDAYFVDIRGYGHSTRPPAMDQPPANNAPFADTRDAVRDVSAAVDFILKRRGVPRINVVGWSWGTTIMGGFAAENPDKVAKLVLYAPVWYLQRPPSYQGAYRTTTREQALTRRGAGVPKDRFEETFPSEWFERWWALNVASDPGGAQRNPPVLRSPNGVMKDLAEIWANGKSTYDPAAIRAPTLVIVGEWDGITPPPMAQEVFKRLANAQYRRLVVLSEGSHAISHERNRMHLLREVQHFLEEPAR